MLATGERLSSMILIIIHCNDLTVIMDGISETATVLSVLMKVYSIPCHDRGHINVMFVLQSCTDPLQVLPGSSIDMFPTSSDGTCDVGNVKVGGDVVVIEESFIAVNEELDIGIKEEEIPEDITFPDINAEPDEVSYLCICLLLDTFYQYPEMSVVFVTSAVLAT